MHSLLSLVLELQPSWHSQAEMKSWYGHAAQAIFLRAIRDDYSHEQADVLAEPNNLHPFTTSNLILISDRSCISSDQGKFFLRFTALNDETRRAVLKTIQPGHSLHPGVILDLADLYIKIVKVHERPAQHALANFTDYESLWTEGVQKAQTLPGTISFRLDSPTYFKSTEAKKLVTQPTPSLVFNSLLDRWNVFSPELIPKTFRSFTRDHMAITLSDIADKKVNDGNVDHVGSVGKITFMTDMPGSIHWMYTHILARFAFYSGVGKGTTSGFGQCMMLD